MQGVYGHTAVWDPATSLVYVHGGLLSHDSTSQVISTLMTYDPIRQEWWVLNAYIIVGLDSDEEDEKIGGDGNDGIGSTG